MAPCWAPVQGDAMKMRRFQRPPRHKRPRGPAVRREYDRLTVDDPNTGNEPSAEAREKMRVWFNEAMNRRHIAVSRPTPWGPDLLSFAEEAARVLGIELTNAARALLRAAKDLPPVVMVNPREAMRMNCDSMLMATTLHRGAALPWPWPQRCP